MQNEIKDTSFQAYFERWLEKFRKDLWKQRQQIFDDFLFVWKELCDKVADSCQLVEYIEISVLRSSLCEKGEVWFILEAFDENWLFGSPIVAMDSHMPILTKIFQLHRECVLREARRYIGKIPAKMVMKGILGIMPKIDQTLAMILGENAESLLSCIKSEKTSYSESIRLSLGEYRRFHYKILFMRCD